MDQLLRLLIAFTVAYLACVLLAREVFAQTAPGGRTIYALPTPAGIIPTEVLGTYSPLPQTPLPTVATSAGVNVSSSATVPVKVGEKTVAVPVTATAQVSRVALARATAKLLPIVSTALAVKELVDLLLPLGYSVASNGQLQAVEKPGIPGDAPGTGYRYEYTGSTAFYGKTPQEACDKMGADWWNKSSRYYAEDWYPEVKVAPATQACVLTFVEKVCERTCIRQTISYGVTKLTNYYTPELVPAQTAAIADDAAKALGNQPEIAKRLYDALQSDWQSNPALPREANPIDASTPIQVNAPPVTTPEQIVKTETRQRPDGSTDIITTKESTTVTPVTTGSTVGDIKTSYTYNTTTTTTTYNDVTNITTIDTATQAGEAPAPQPSQDPCEFDPSRLGCKELDPPPEAEAIPKIEVPFSFDPLNFASAAGCPSPVRFNAYGPREISFQPLCDVMTQLRPLFLACASLATAFIFLRGIRQL